MFSTRLSLAALLLAVLTNKVLAAPKVIASIVPVHALVAGVMDGVAEPELLLSGTNSEHQASYSPEQIRSLGEADLVFIIGRGLELKLDEISGSEAVGGKRFVELSEIDGLTKHPIRQGGAWEAHEHGEGSGAHGDHGEASGKDHDAEGQEEGHEHGHEHGTAEFDPHIWLDPENAKLMVGAIAAALAKADPENAPRYAANAKTVTAGLDDLSTQLDKELQPVKDKPYVVFHDAYQYFERRFGLAAAGSISDISASAPSAKRLSELRKKLAEAKAACVFREPQFSDRAVQTVIEGTAAKEGVLDPIGASLQPGKGAYHELLSMLAQNLKTCLQAS